MKILVLVACLLTISYAINPESLKKFYDKYQNCLNALNVPEWTPQVVKCMIQSHQLLDDQGVIKKDKVFAVFEKLITNEDNLNQAKEIVSTCYDQEYQGQGSNDEKTMSVIECAMEVNDLFDKLE